MAGRKESGEHMQTQNYMCLLQSPLKYPMGMVLTMLGFVVQTNATPRPWAGMYARSWGYAPDLTVTSI